MGDISFFKIEDLEFLHKWGGQSYVKNEHQAVREQLKNGPWAKTEHWCSELAKETNLEYEFGYYWQNHKIIRPYTWGKIIHPEQWTTEMFYTVGVNTSSDDLGESFLHLKIDYDFREHRDESKRELSQYQLDFLQDNLRPNGIVQHENRWNLSDLKQFDWDILIQQSVQFINDTYSRYLVLLSEAAELEKHQRRVHRHIHNLGMYPSLQVKCDSFKEIFRRKPTQYQIYRLHDKINAYFKSYLESIHSSEILAIENEVMLEESRVDLIVQKGSKAIFYEIKTHRKLKNCVREAIGQLLEYAYYNEHHLGEVERMVIVSHHPPDEATIQYLRKLRDTGLKLYYQQVDPDSDHVGNEV